MINTDKPQISVIVPNYNYERYLKQRIESILNQSYENFEVIILDDASSDKSSEMISTYINHPKVSKIIINDYNSGSPFPQWDKGVRLAKGDYIWIAEADDFCSNTLLEDLIKPLKENKNIGISYCQSYVVDGEGNVQEIWGNGFNNSKDQVFKQSFSENGLVFIKNHLIYINVIPNSSAVIFRRDLYMKVGGVNKEIKKCADWHLWIKMLTKSDVAFCQKPLNFFRRHEKSVIASKDEKDKDRFVSGNDVILRKEINSWFTAERSVKTIVADIIHKNNYFINHDLGLTGLFDFKRKRYLKAIKKISVATLKNRKLSYIKILASYYGISR